MWESSWLAIRELLPGSQALWLKCWVFLPEFFPLTGTGTRRRGLSHGRSGSNNTGTGRRGGLGKKRRDPRSRRGSSRYWWGPGRRLARPPVMGRSSCLHAGTGIQTGAWVLRVNGVHRV